MRLSCLAIYIFSVVKSGLRFRNGQFFAFNSLSFCYCFDTGIGFSTACSSNRGEWSRGRSTNISALQLISCEQVDEITILLDFSVIINST